MKLPEVAPLVAIYPRYSEFEVPTLKSPIQSTVEEPLGAVQATVTEPPETMTLGLAVSVYVPVVAPACWIEKLCPAIVIVAERALLLVLAATV